MTLSEIAAWWGASIATLVFAWDIYKWKHAGASLRVTAAPNMEPYGNLLNQLTEKTWVIIEVVNSGNKKTTLTHQVGFHYPSWFAHIRRKSDKKIITLNPGLDRPLPCALEPGERWLGGMVQNEELEKLSREGYLYCGVYHSGSRKASLVRLVVPDANAA